MTEAAAAAASAPQTNPWMIAPVVAVAAFMEVLDISVANVALPHIAGDLSVSQDESTWVLTSYLITNAIIMPITGWLAGRFGRKRLFVSCIVMFTVVSLLCGLAPSLPVLVLLRGLQGAAGGGLQPTGQAILNDAFPAEQRGMATAVYAVAVVVAPAIGPALGGWIADNFDWRWVFLINVPVGVALAFLIGSLVKTPQEDAPKKGGKVDWQGFALVAICLGCLQIVLDRGQEYDWFSSTLVTGLCIASAIAFVLLIWWEVPHRCPMVNLRLLKRRDFAVAFALMMALGIMVFGSAYLLPAFAQYVMEYPAMQAGLILMPGGLLLMLLFPVVGRLLNKVDLRVLIAIGLLITGSSLWWMTSLYRDVSFNTLALARTAQYVGMAFLFLPINALGFRNVPAGQTNYASALINLARNFGGSIGVAFASTLIVRREQFHQSRMVEHLQSMNGAYPEWIEQLGHATTHGANVATTTLAQALQAAVHQASLLSYLDAFKALGTIVLLLLPFLLFVKRGTANGHAGEAA